MALLKGALQEIKRKGKLDRGHMGCAYSRKKKLSFRNEEGVYSCLTEIIFWRMTTHLRVKMTLLMEEKKNNKIIIDDSVILFTHSKFIFRRKQGKEHK